MTFNEKVAQLVKSGAELVKDVTIKNVRTKIQVNYAIITVRLDNTVKSLTYDDNGEEVILNEDFIIFNSFKLRTIFEETPELSPVCDYVMAHPYNIGLILTGAKINILQDRAKGQTEYVDPLSNNPNDILTFNNDRYVNHIIKIELSSNGRKELEQTIKDMRSTAL